MFKYRNKRQFEIIGSTKEVDPYFLSRGIIDYISPHIKISDRIIFLTGQPDINILKQFRERSIKIKKKHKN